MLNSMLKRLTKLHKQMHLRKAGLIALLLCVSLSINMLPYYEVSATSGTLDKIHEAENQKKETEKEKKEAEDEKSKAQSDLNKLQYEQGTLKQKVSDLNRELSEAGKALEEIEGRISDKEAEIAQTEKELEEAIATEENQYESMKKRVQYMYEQPQDTYIDMLFNSSSISEFLNMTDYILMIADYDRNMLIEYKEFKASVEDQKAKLEEEKAELDELKAANEAEQARINDLIKTTSEYVDQYSKQISGVRSEINEIEGEIAQKEAEIAAKEANIAALKAQYQEELRKSQEAKNAAKRDISQVAFDGDDRYLLANLIYCEAGGEGYEGQLAVGAVVVNRMLSSKYPDSISGVIYQYKQFSPVGDGHLALALAENRATDSCYKAADDAMAGVTNVGGCYYFRTPIEGLTGLQIGGHIFY